MAEDKDDNVLIPRGPGPVVKILIALVGTMLSLLALSYDKGSFKPAHIEMPEILLAVVVAVLLALLSNSYEILTYMREVGRVAEDAKKAAADARGVIATIKSQTGKIIEGHNQQQEYKENYARLIAEHVLTKLTEEDVFAFGEQEIRLKGEYLALEAYQELFKQILERLENDPSSRITVHAFHSTSINLWKTSRGEDFLSLQAAIIRTERCSITRLIVGAAKFEDLMTISTSCG